MLGCMDTQNVLVIVVLVLLAIALLVFILRR
jgi:hypothetical protein